MKRIAISIGDLNGIGIELALRNHQEISTKVNPVYCIDRSMLEQAANLLQLSIPDDFQTTQVIAESFTIKPGRVDAASGRYSYASFVKAVEMAKQKQVDAIVTLPIHKKAWELAGIHYRGHTDALRDFFDADAIMMLGSPKMYVALFTEHIPLREVAGKINEKDLTRFLLDFHRSIQNSTFKIRPKGSALGVQNSKIAVLGLNPHAGDNGVLGDEEKIIQKSIDNANKLLNARPERSALGVQRSTLLELNSDTPASKEKVGYNATFTDPMVPDVAFIPHTRAQYTYYVAMYHDQGLTPLKALYFDEGINVSLNLPILRTSVDHGTAFDIAYRDSTLSSLSYLNAVKYILQTRQ